MIALQKDWRCSSLGAWESESSLALNSLSTEPDGHDGVEGASAPSLAPALMTPVPCCLSTGLFGSVADVRLPRVTTTGITALGR